MNKEVSFPLAKLLKEKGFDEQTDKYYVQVFQDTFKLTRHKLWEMDEESGFQDAPHFLAPTIAEVVMWLYEKYKIWISVGGDCDYKFKFEIHTWKWYEPEKSYRLGHTVLGETFWDCRSKEFSSPTEAYEAAIEYALNNLI